MHIMYLAKFFSFRENAHNFILISLTHRFAQVDVFVSKLMFFCHESDFFELSVTRQQKNIRKFELNVRSISLPQQAKFPPSPQRLTSIINKIHSM